MDNGPVVSRIYELILEEPASGDQIRVAESHRAAGKLGRPADAGAGER